EDNYFIALARYIEGNARQAGLIKRAEDWKWSSAWRRTHGTVKQKKLLARWPVSVSERYLKILNISQSKEEEEAIEVAIRKGCPFGDGAWVSKTVDRYDLKS